jgi:CRISPR-associated endonuclease/helicase Cas3
VDEVHAYDHYMLQILENELKGLAAAGASVVMLSATLPFKVRERLLKAFYSGRNGSPNDIVCECTGYPLVSAVGCVEPLGDVFAFEEEVATRALVRRELEVKLIDSQEEVFEQIRIALTKGQCLCWIRNTVGDALDAFSILQDSGAVSKDRLHLFHSRFAMGDRLNIENEILRYFGKNSVGKERSGRILIATQVVEQSLDLDFDILISDLAPIDYLIQRAGRQHRHMRDEFGDPVHKLSETINREKPTFYIYGPTSTTEPEADWFSRVFPGAAYIYEDTGKLWKTQQLLYTHGKIKMPEMAREFIEGVYGDDSWKVPDVFHKAKNKVEGKDSGKRSMGSFNSINFSEGYSLASSARWAEEEQIPTRLGADQQVAYLSTYMEGRLVPFHQGEFAWDKSSLRIPMGSLQNLILTDEEERAIENLRKISRKFYENDLIVVLENKDGAWEAEGESANGTSVSVHYDQVTGWQLRKTKNDV